MKKLILVLAIMLSFTGFAQEKNSKAATKIEQKADAITQKMVKYLDLTSTQKEKVHTINLEIVKKKMEVERMSSEEKRNAAKNIEAYKATIKEKMNAILNEKQMQGWETIMKNEVAAKKKKMKAKN